MIYKLVIWIVRFGTSILCRIDAPDLDKVPRRGPLIIYSNHTGQIEVALLFSHLQPRPLTGWAKIESWDNLFLHWLFNLWGAIPVRRGEGDTTALRKAIAVLEKGYIFGIAPEGTRNVTGRLKRAHPGAVMLALHSGAPLLPLAHWGGEDFLKNLAHFKRTDFHVRVGEQFRLNLDGVRITRETRQQIVDEMMYRLAEMLPQKYRGAYEMVTENPEILIKAGRITEADLA
jgi:1-acyl-sn-glycerol-3-phosphate acyltransferase